MQSSPTAISRDSSKIFEAPTKRAYTWSESGRYTLIHAAIGGFRLVTLATALVSRASSGRVLLHVTGV